MAPHPMPHDREMLTMVFSQLTVVGIPDVLQWHGITRSVIPPPVHHCAAVGLERRSGDNPGAHCRGKVLGREQTKWHVFLLLNAASARVIHEDVSKYPPLGLLGGHGPADCTAAAIALSIDFGVRWSADYECHLQIKIE